MDPLPAPDLAALARAREILESPGLAMRLASQLGRPIDWGLARLPDRARGLVASATRAALERALAVAVHTLDRRQARPAADWLHRAAVLATGAAGGAFGLAGLPVELPVSTVVMLRSVADHARAQGEDLSSPEARLNCLVVFALGGSGSAVDPAGYLAVRHALARSVAEAAAWVAGRTASEEVAERGAPVLVRLVTAIAARFGLAVEDKLAAQLVPVIGAAGGALVNGVFMAHYQSAAWGHFTVRRLERAHGSERIQTAYRALGEAGPSPTVPPAGLLR
jgi:hypothetical protein